MILKTADRGLQKKSVDFSRHGFLNVFNIVKLLSVKGSFHRGREKIPQVRDEEDEVGSVSPQHRASP
jgi:hypothetical protein